MAANSKTVLAAFPGGFMLKRRACLDGRISFTMVSQLMNNTLPNLKQISTRELFTLYGATLAELRNRGITRSTNNPIADYAELLYVTALRLSRAEKSTKGYDALGQEGLKYEIKGRRVTAHNSSRQLSALRSLDQKHFDFLGGVLFNEDFSVHRACLIPHQQVLKNSKYISHTNSWTFFLHDSVWDLPGVEDVTTKLRKAEKLHV